MDLHEAIGELDAKLSEYGRMRDVLVMVHEAERRAPAIKAETAHAESERIKHEQARIDAGVAVIAARDEMAQVIAEKQGALNELYAKLEAAQAELAAVTEQIGTKKAEIDRYFDERQAALTKMEGRMRGRS